MAHVNKLAAEVEAAEKEIYGNPDGTPGAPTPADPAQAPVTEQTTEPVASAVEPQVPSKQPAQVAPPAAAAPELQEPVATPTEPSQEDWKLRFTRYKASADATIHGLRQNDVALREALQAERQKSAELTAKIADVATGKDPMAVLFTP